MRLQVNKSGRSEFGLPVEANYFVIEVPKNGYEWVEHGSLLPLFEGRLVGPPYMVMRSTEDRTKIEAREYFPLREQPNLFVRFRDLALVKEEILAFANRYGWLGEIGAVQLADGRQANALDLATWRAEIQYDDIGGSPQDVHRARRQGEIEEIFSLDTSRIQCSDGHRDGRPPNIWTSSVITRRNRAFLVLEFDRTGGGSLFSGNEVESG